MRSRSLLMTAALSIGLLAAAQGTSLALPTTCQDLLANNRYSCTYKGEGDTAGTLCFQFVSPNLYGKFDLQTSSADSPTLATTLVCMCEATGSYRNPRFDASKTFLCGNPEFGDAGTAKISGNGRKILQGSYFLATTDGPQAHTFECVLDPACDSTPPPVSAARTHPSTRGGAVPAVRK